MTFSRWHKMKTLMDVNAVASCHTLQLSLYIVWVSMHLVWHARKASFEERHACHQHLHCVTVSAGQHTASNLHAPRTFRGGLFKHLLHCCIRVNVQNHGTPCTVHKSSALCTVKCTSQVQTTQMIAGILTARLMVIHAHTRSCSGPYVPNTGECRG